MIAPVRANPFRPTFGTSPPLLVGREEQLDAFAASLQEGPGSPGRATVYTGARGVGKTVVLNAVEDIAQQMGWLVVSETATAGLIDRLVLDGLPAARGRLAGDDKPRRRVTNISLPIVGGGVGFDVVESRPTPALRNQIAELTDATEQFGTGVLITVDEIQAADINELRALATSLQHAFREGRNVAFVAAGLPAALEPILNDDVLTFLRRADRYDLSAVDVHEVARAIDTPIREAGRTIEVEALNQAAEATAGYPFMIQLVGYHSYRQRPERDVIDAADVVAGIDAARRKLGQLVIEPELDGLSDVDRACLVAMAHDDGPSKMADIQHRLGDHVDANYASQYRLRLIAAEVVVQTRRGYVDFALPAMRDYLRKRDAPPTRVDSDT
jgi:AAA ATPase domain